MAMVFLVAWEFWSTFVCFFCLYWQVLCLKPLKMSSRFFRARSPKKPSHPPHRRVVLLWVAIACTWILAGMFGASIWWPGDGCLLESHPMTHPKFKGGRKDEKKTKNSSFFSKTQKMMDDVQLFDVFFVLRMSQPWSMMEAISLQSETKGSRSSSQWEWMLKVLCICILSWCNWIDRDLMRLPW